MRNVHTELYDFVRPYRGDYFHSQFFYHRVAPNCVVVIDTGHGMSVTNDAENVVRLLYDRGVLRHDDHLVYCDTDKMWDVLCHAHGDFVCFKALREPTLSGALTKLGVKLS